VARVRAPSASAATSRSRWNLNRESRRHAPESIEAPGRERDRRAMRRQLAGSASRVPLEAPATSATVPSTRTTRARDGRCLPRLPCVGSRLRSARRFTRGIRPNSARASGNGRATLSACAALRTRPRARNDRHYKRHAYVVIGVTPMGVNPCFVELEESQTRVRSSVRCADPELLVTATGGCCHGVAVDVDRKLAD
jgi:hypothetical protein